MAHFADLLQEAIRRKGTPALVGLDPRADLLPGPLRQRFELSGAAPVGRWAKGVGFFCREVLEAVADLVPAVKIQSAFFELYGAAGIEALEETIRRAHQLDLLVILDAKRGDISTTASAYAQAAFGGAGAFDQLPARDEGADALTINPYLGRDSMEPFLQYTHSGKGLFVLVHTSNPGAGDLQQLETGSDGRAVYEVVADWVEEWNRADLGQSNYGPVGAVVGATAQERIVQLRRRMPHALFLLPGYGAQGGTARDTAAAFDSNGCGALINSSRSVVFPWSSRGEATGGWQQEIVVALKSMIQDIAQHTPAGLLAGAP